MADVAGTGELSRDALSAYAREMIEKGSKSFSRAATLMPAEIRDSVHLLYAWCRYCDDFIDDQNLGFALQQPADGVDIVARVGELRMKTLAAYRGEAEEAPFQALALVVRKHAIPEKFALDLIDGFTMDAAGQEYATERDTLRYCYHVAGAVGVMMAMVMGVRDRSTLIRACDLGIAFQLTNISRDVIADADSGRVYLPAEWLDEAGLDATSIGDPAKRQQLFAVVTRLLYHADGYYDSAKEGIGRLPFRCAWSIASAHRIYRAIGSEIRRAGPAAWDCRARTNGWQKVGHVGLAATDAASAATLGRRIKPRPRDHLWTPPALREDARASVADFDAFSRASA